jgi:predicted nucleotidyltransferase
MTFGLNEPNYRALKKAFQSAPDVERVLIFGSRARGDAKEGSDFDLAVFAPKMSDADFARLWETVDGVELIFKIDLIHFERLNNPVLRERILAEGRPFFTAGEA